MLRNRIYFRLKPFIPRSVRLRVRRWLSRWKRKRIQDVWPIMPGSESAPSGWRGWPEGKKFALVLSHDVEGKVGLNKCRQLMQLEMELGFRSSFNFIPEGSYRVPPNLRDELVRNGFEVGIHDLKHDGRLFASRREFKQRATRINQYVREWGAVGFRSGFMLHKLEWLHDLDIQYDASTFDTDPFEPQPEGRHTIFPFWVPQCGPTGLSLPPKNAQRGYVELPYTLPQDSTLFLLLGEKSEEVWVRKLDWIAEHGGMAMIDTHPDYMAFPSDPRNGEYPVEHYVRFLEYVRSKYADAYWPALPKQVAAHVVKNATTNVANEETYSRFAPSRADNEGGISISSPVVVPVNGTCFKEQGSTPSNKLQLRGKHAAVLLFSYYPEDPRPRRAAQALVQEGVTVDLLCLQEHKAQPRRETVDGISVFRVPLQRHRGGKMTYIGRYSAFIVRSFCFLAFRSFIRKYDLVHVHNMPDALVFSALIPKLLGAKVVLDLHDPMPELMQTIFAVPDHSLSVRFLKRLEKWSIGFADLALTVNLACKKLYTSRSCAAGKIQVVLNSPEDDIFVLHPAAAQANGNQSSKPFTILYHGSLVERNGFDLAVEALEITRKSIPSARLMVCGARTSFFERVMESAQGRRLGDAINYAGIKDRTQIVEAILNCNLGIIPNHRNVFTEINTPTRIFEYLALGRPVVAPRAAGINDYFTDGDLIFFELGNATDLAEKIEFAYRQPQEVEKIVKRGQQVYLGHTWDREKSHFLESISALW
jgi:glycosyltransferase involved in cell wall biosynthesis